MDNSVSAQAIGKYERDEAMPRSGVLIALAEALDVSVDYLRETRASACRGWTFAAGE